MENQIQKVQETVPVNLVGVQHLVPMTVIQNLPELVRKEICHPKLNQNTEESKKERMFTTNRIISMLDVKFNGETDAERNQDRKLSISEFGTFLRSFVLTGPEVIEAYRMALSGELNYKVYPTLSLVQCGEILQAYLVFRNNSKMRDDSLKKLKGLLEPPKKERSETEKKQDEISTYKRIFESIKNYGFSSESHILYEDLEQSGKLRNWDKKMKKRFFNYVKMKWIEEKKSQAATGMGSAVFIKNMMRDEELIDSLVKSRCREIFVSNYLKKHCENFETFLKTIKQDYESTFN